jgi:hypothetical protein
MTKRKLNHERKQALIEDNMGKFGKVSIGVHGFELPKFRDSLDQKEWWKLSCGFNQSPNYNSAKVLRSSIKGKIDQMALADS